VTEEACHLLRGVPEAVVTHRKRHPSDQYSDNCQAEDRSDRAPHESFHCCYFPLWALGAVLGGGWWLNLTKSLFIRQYDLEHHKAEQICYPTEAHAAMGRTRV
jgi:hypothetical protein